MADLYPRSITFSIPGELGLPGLQVTVVENAGNLDFMVEGITAESRGLFFQLIDESVLRTLKILGGDGLITKTQIKANGVIASDMNNTFTFDVGVAFKATTGPVHFTLDATRALTLDDIANAQFGTVTVGNQLTSGRFVAPAAPDAKNDTVTTQEDKAITIHVLANDTDADFQPLTVTSVHLESGTHGTVSIAANGKSITYTPDKDYAGTNFNPNSIDATFKYTVSDGFGGQDTASVNIHVTPVADVPNLTYKILAGSTAYETIVRVTATQTDADKSEFIDQITLSGIPAIVSVSESVFNPAGQDLSLVHDFVLTLPSVGNTSFDLGITATAQELSNGDQQTNTISAPIAFENKENDYTPSFLATNQSIWNSGAAFTFTDSHFIGIDGGDSGSGGTGEPPHSDDLIGFSYDAHVKAGFQSDLSFNGGTITANLNYNLGVDTHYNKTTDTLLITSSKLLTGGDFTTVGPQGHYKLDFIFSYDIAAKVTYDIGVDFGNIIDIHPTFNSTTNIIDLDSKDLSVGFDFPDPFGSLSATLAWPNITTDANSSSPPPGEFSSDGASNNFFTLTLDVDQALADIILKGANPFAIPFDIPGLVDGTIELADLDLSGGLNFLETFVMQEQPLTAKLKFEDGTEQAFTFGTDLVLPNAKLIDQGGNNNGIVEFQLFLDAQATLHNDTDLGFNIGYNFDLMKIEYDAGLAGSGTIGPLFNIGGTLPLGSVDVYDSTFALNFGAQSVGFFL